MKQYECIRDFRDLKKWDILEMPQWTVYLQDSVWVAFSIDSLVEDGVLKQIIELISNNK